MTMENFGKNQLLKYGWSEGKGLGKSESGMIEALRPKLKFDTAGIGHKETDIQWWKFVYNKAASNVDIKENALDIRFKAKDKSVDVKSSSTGASANSSKENLVYGNFIKTSTLEDGKVTNHSNPFSKKVNNTIDESNLVLVNDEELFKLCNGRTAHKGARHGLKLNGKLERIKKQEEELAKQLESAEVDESWVRVEKKKKKENKSRNKLDQEVIEEISDFLRSAEPVIKDDSDISDASDLPLNDHTNDCSRPVSKKTRRKNKRKLESLTKQLEASLDLSASAEVTTDPATDKIRKRKSRDKDSDGDVEMEEKKKCKSKKKCKKNETNDQRINCNNASSIDPDSPQSIDDFTALLAESCEKKRKEKVKVLSANYLNNRISKKKKCKAAKKAKKKLEFISKSLNDLDLEKSLNVNDKLCEEISSEEVVKSRKKKKNKRKDL